MKKILFSILGLFTVFLINTNVYASSADIIEKHYISYEEYFELYQKLVDNFNNEYNEDGDIILGNRSFDNHLWISRVYYNSSTKTWEKNYYVIYYDKITCTVYTSSDGTVSMQFKNFIEFVIDTEGNITHYRDARNLETYSSWSPLIINRYLTDDFSVNKYSYHIISSLMPLYIYDDYWNKTNLKFFYDPSYNFEKDVTAEDFTTDLDNKVNDYENDTNKPWYSKFFNAIIAIPSAIVNGIKDAFSSIGNFFVDLGNTIGGFLVDLGNNILNGLKDLIIPDTEFMKLGFNHFMELLETKLGFVYDTFDLIFDILNKFLNLNDSNHTINIPALKEPFSGTTIYEGTTFDFDLFLEQNNISYLHTIYLWFVDALIALAFFKQGLRIFDLVTTGYGAYDQVDLMYDDYKYERRKNKNKNN